MKRIALGAVRGAAWRISATLLTGALALSSAPASVVAEAVSPEGELVTLDDGVSATGETDGLETSLLEDVDQTELTDVEAPSAEEGSSEEVTELEEGDFFGPKVSPDVYVTLSDGSRDFLIGTGDASADEMEYALGYEDEGEVVPSVHDANEDLTGLEDNLPASYDSRGQGYVTPVRNQGPYGTCWAHATLAAIEAYAVSHLGYDVTSTDLSERHLAYQTYAKTAPDPLGNTDGDLTILKTGQKYLRGGNFRIASITLSNGYGAVDENDAPYQPLVDNNDLFGSDYDAFVELTALPDALARQGRVRLRNAYFVTGSDRDDIKRAVMDNGVVGINYHHVGALLRRFTSGKVTYYCGHVFYNADGTEAGTNHAVSVVGWDDSFDRSYFKDDEGRQPEENGAWLIKNSWGTDWPMVIDHPYMDGYFWISYEDYYLLNKSTVLIAEAEDDSKSHDHLYYYDGTLSGWTSSLSSGGSIANVFTANANASGELLEAVDFSLADANADYSVQVYLDPSDAADPTSGMPALTTPVTGKTRYQGIYRVDLPDPVELSCGQTFAVVVTLSHADGTNVKYYFDKSYSYAAYDCLSTSEAGQSFYWYGPGNPWRDRSASGDSNNRIKAYTDDRTTEVINPEQEIIAPHSLTVVLGKTKSLNATTTGDGKLTYKSFNTDVATVSSKGVVKGVQTGSAVVTITAAKTASYNKASKQVRVAVKLTQEITAPSSLTVGVGKTKSLGATTTGNGTLTYKSAKTSVATVSSKGVVKGVKAGSTSVTVTAAETSNYTKATRKVSVTVKKVPTITASDKSVAVGKTVALDATTTSDALLTYKSADKAIATVSSAGKVKGVAVGSTTVTITAAETDACLKASKKVGVTVKLTPTITASSSLSVAVGKTKSLGAATTSDALLTYKSADKSIATVSSAGKVKGVKAGSTTVTITAAETDAYLKATKKVTVTVK